MGPSTSGSSNGAWPLAGASLPSISNLSKLPFAARSASPARSAVGNARVASPALSESGARQRLTLEDRLKARFALGDASPGDTPDPSQHNTPLPENKTLSPASTPLPSSPTLSPSNVATPALTLQIEPLAQNIEPEVPTPTTSDSAFDTAEEDSQSVAATETSRQSFEDNTPEDAPEANSLAPDVAPHISQQDDTQQDAPVSPVVAPSASVDDAEPASPSPPSSITPGDIEAQLEAAPAEQAETTPAYAESLPTPTLESSSAQPIEQIGRSGETKSDLPTSGADVTSDVVQSVPAIDHNAETTVQSLREQMKLLEQRFAG